MSPGSWGAEFTGFGKSLIPRLRKLAQDCVNHRWPGGGSTQPRNRSFSLFHTASLHHHLLNVPRTVSPWRRTFHRFEFWPLRRVWLTKCVSRTGRVFQSGFSAAPAPQQAGNAMQRKDNDVDSTPWAWNGSSFCTENSLHKRYSMKLCHAVVGTNWRMAGKVHLKMRLKTHCNVQVLTWVGRFLDNVNWFCSKFPGSITPPPFMAGKFKFNLTNGTYWRVLIFTFIAPRTMSHKRGKALKAYNHKEPAGPAKTRSGSNRPAVTIEGVIV